ncbi:nucleotidyltransferase family protein [Litorimonas sp. WD9-15]|uniref:nucleotidyltransferase family protein n=1 Tax=Litorimonas sp. WD9-15 TaxID=3418716 RepID=UPI003CFCB8B2
MSERFGAVDKLQADLCGRPLLSHMLETVRSVGFREVFIVSQTLSAFGTRTVINKNPEAGQGHALRLGVRACLDAGWSRVMVVLGDMPLIGATYLEAMIEASENETALVSLCDGRRLPPAIFDGSALEQILAQDSSSGARAIFDQLNPATFPLDADSAQDVDMPQDLIRVAAIMKSRST